jgi:hypothetical protein
MKRHVKLFFLGICIISIHYAQAADADFSLIPKLTDVEKLVYPYAFSETTSFGTRKIVYSKDCVNIFTTNDLFVHPLHERNVPRKAKEVCSLCYTRFFTKSLNVIKNRISNLEKQQAVLHIDVLSMESAINKLGELSTRLSNNYVAACEKMACKTMNDNKLYMELICCAIESPTEVLDIINKYGMLITTVEKADCYSFQHAILKWTSQGCCDHAPKLSIPQQDIITCVQFGNVRTFNDNQVFSVAYEEGNITTECCILCPVVCRVLGVQKYYNKKYKEGKIDFPDNFPQPGENQVFGAGEDGDFIPRHRDVPNWGRN